ncbi:MAG: phosphotransferase, partial [Planctomycetes bacterium]|nr:phosphotransferase [Planctomycetota bacterium]
MPADLAPLEVLSRYPAILQGPLTFLGNHGGFSGARLWRVDTPAGSSCLKAWPTDARTPQDLTWIHGLMARASRLPWLPRVMATSDGATFIVHQGRLWELTTWMPGVADFSAAPTPARLTAACTALAELHRAWSPVDTNTDLCPAILRRMDSWRTWQQLVQTGWRPAWQPADPYAAIAETLWRQVANRIDAVPRLLTPWLTQRVPVQPCVCDLWHDHVLFTGDAITGIIDFGSVKVDHPAVDLARLLGSLIGDDEERWETGLAAYARIRPLSPGERQLARDLDHTGTVLAGAHWLRWLYHERRIYERPDLVVARMTAL